MAQKFACRANFIQAVVRTKTCGHNLHRWMERLPVVHKVLVVFGRLASFFSQMTRKKVGTQKSDCNVR